MASAKTAAKAKKVSSKKTAVKKSSAKKTVAKKVAKKTVVKKAAPKTTKKSKTVSVPLVKDPTGKVTVRSVEEREEASDPKPAETVPVYDPETGTVVMTPKS